MKITKRLAVSTHTVARRGPNDNGTLERGAAARVVWLAQQACVCSSLSTAAALLLSGGDLSGPGCTDRCPDARPRISWARQKTTTEEKATLKRKTVPEGTARMFATRNSEHAAGPPTVQAKPRKIAPQDRFARRSPDRR